MGVAASAYHCLAVTDSGKVFGWGDKDGLGLELNESQLTPLEYPHLRLR